MAQPKKEKNSNWIKDLNLRPETNKLRGKHFYINFNKILFDPPPEVMEIKINKWDLTNLKSSGTARETINKMKNSK